MMTGKGKKFKGFLISWGRNQFSLTACAFFKSAVFALLFKQSPDIYSNTCRYFYIAFARNICVIKFRVGDYIVFSVNKVWGFTLLMKLLSIPFAKEQLLPLLTLMKFMGFW
jgi:hypothetical protein